VAIHLDCHIFYFSVIFHYTVNMATELLHSLNLFVISLNFVFVQYAKMLFEYNQPLRTDSNQSTPLLTHNSSYCIDCSHKIVKFVVVWGVNALNCICLGV